MKQGAAHWKITLLHILQEVRTIYKTRNQLILWARSAMPYTAMLVSLALLVSASAVVGRALAADAHKTSQTIARAGSQASTTGPAEFFTGTVRIDPLFPANEP